MNQILSKSHALTSTLENETIGLKMVIEDQNQLQIISRELVPSIKGSMSLSLFNYHEETLVYLIVLTEEEDRSGLTAILLKALGRHGYQSYGDMRSQNGLHYYLTCLDPGEDAAKGTLIQSIQNAYDHAEFSAPVMPVIETVDFKAFTLDGKELGNELFQAKDYTMLYIWRTTCKTCLEDIPKVTEWEKELPENVQVRYIHAERISLEKLDRTQLDQKIAETGIDPDHALLYQTGFSRVIDIVLSATPATLFVDSKGNIIGDAILGPVADRCEMIVKGLLKNKSGEK